MRFFVRIGEKTRSLFGLEWFRPTIFIQNLNVFISENFKFIIKNCNYIIPDIESQFSRHTSLEPKTGFSESNKKTAYRVLFHRV